MSWGQACQEMVEGRRVRIKDWSSWVTVGFDKNGVLEITTLTGGPLSYIPIKADMISTDWEVAE